MQLNRDQWTAPRALPYESVPVPEIEPDGEALVWTLNGLEQDEYHAYRLKASKDADKSATPCPFSAIAVVFAVKDEKGNRIFTTDDITALSRQPAPALDRIWVVFSRLNRLRPSDSEEAGKNSKKASGSDSSSGSQENSAESM